MTLSARFEQAVVWACQLHAEQRRKGTGVPYVAHLLAVASIALEHGANEDQAIAALLHDAVEDQGGLAVADQIRRRYGDEVADIVLGCTDAEVQPKPPWRERKEAYVAHLASAPPTVLLVSASDKLHNARSMLSDYRIQGEDLWSRFRGGREGTLWYYRAIARAFVAHFPGPLADEIDRVVTELEQLAGVNADRSD